MGYWNFWQSQQLTGSQKFHKKNMNTEKTLRSLKTDLDNTKKDIVFYREFIDLRKERVDALESAIAQIEEGLSKEQREDLIGEF